MDIRSRSTRVKQSNDVITFGGNGSENDRDSSGRNDKDSGSRELWLSAIEKWREKWKNKMEK
jgi:hypothetical protein